MRRLLTALPLLALLCAVATPASAHKSSDGFITLDIEGTTLSGQVDLALRDLEVVFHLDADGDGKITWGELRARQSELTRYVTERLQLVSNNGPCALVPLDLQVSTYTDGAYASLIFDTTCADRPLTSLDVTYSGLFDVDAQHRGLIKLTYREEQITGVVTPESRTFHFSAAGAGSGHRLLAFVKEGMHHIYRGFDHCLFLIALVLAAVFFRAKGLLVARPRLSAVLWNAAKVVSAFTLAHSLSLAVTTFHLIPAPPTRAVEALVAGTILLTALNNVVPLVNERVWLAGFAFGLIHGIGYASVLGDLGLTGWSLAGPLFGFNLGVELAQLTVLMSFLPVAFLLRHTFFYRRIVLIGGSLATGGLATVWMIEQLFQLKIFGF